MLVYMSKAGPQTASESVNPKTRTSTWSKVFVMREAGTLAALVLIVLVFAVAIPQFRPWENVINITRNFYFVGNTYGRPISKFGPVRGEATEEKIMHLTALGSDNIPMQE
jgi:hypothetical protein